MSEKTTQSEVLSEKYLIKDILSTFSVVLRYIASGFIGLLVYSFLFWKEIISEIKNMDHHLISGSTWLILIAAASLGLITYSIHRAHFDILFHSYHLKKILNKKKYELSDTFKQAIRDSYNCFDSGHKMSEKELFESKKKIRFGCMSQSFLRHISEDKKIVRLQALMDERYAMLAFTYCAIYQSVIVSLYCLSSKLVAGDFSKFDGFKLSVVACITFIVWLCVCKFDRRICKREIWVISNFYLPTPSPNSETSK